MSTDRIRAVILDTGYPATIERIRLTDILERVGASETLKGLDLVVVKIESDPGRVIGTSSAKLDARAAELSGKTYRGLYAGSYAVVAIDPETLDPIDIDVVLAGMLTGAIAETAAIIAPKPASDPMRPVAYTDEPGI